MTSWTASCDTTTCNHCSSLFPAFDSTMRKKRCLNNLIGLGAHQASKTTGCSRSSTLYSFVSLMKIKTRGNRYWHFFVDYLWISLPRKKIKNKNWAGFTNPVSEKNGNRRRIFLNFLRRAVLLGLYTIILLASSLLTISFRDRRSQGGHGLACTRIHYSNPITLNRKWCPRKRQDWKSWGKVPPSS